MKKLVLAALAIASMAACTKSNVQYEQPGEITLQPVAQKATKAAVDGAVYPTDVAYNFNVWAWWANETDGTELAEFNANITPYIANGTFVYKSDVTSWGGSTPYYWPTKGSLVFAGYSPAGATGTFNYYLQASGTEGDDDYIAPYTLKITDYIQSNNIAVAKDLMWFDVTDQSYDKNGTENKGVPVTFKHALSWLTFKFNLSSSNTDRRWTITDVMLKGIEDKATFTAVKGETETNARWRDAALSTTGKDVIDVFTGTSYIVEYSENGTVLPGTDVTVENSNVKSNAVLVIPQSCAPAVVDADGNVTTAADAELVITYNLKTYIGENNYLNGQTVTLPLNGSPINDNKWEPGKHYIYTITFGANEILIAPTVADWTDVPVANIPVQ